MPRISRIIANDLKIKMKFVRISVISGNISKLDFQSFVMSK